MHPPSILCRKFATRLVSAVSHRTSWWSVASPVVSPGAPPQSPSAQEGFGCPQPFAGIRFVGIRSGPRAALRWQLLLGSWVVGWGFWGFGCETYAAEMSAAETYAEDRRSEASGLEGRELQEVSNLKSEVGSLLVGLLRGEEAPQGRILGVRVVEDRPDFLRLTVFHQGLGDLRLRGQVLNGEQRLLRWIDSEPVPLTRGSKPADLDFRLAMREGEGEAPESAYLLLEVIDHRRSRSLLQRTFRLPKTWTPPGAAQDLVVEITPVAVGRAASLAPDPRPNPPPRPRPRHPRDWGDFETAPPRGADSGGPLTGGTVGGDGSSSGGSSVEGKADPPSQWRTLSRGPGAQGRQAARGGLGRAGSAAERTSSAAERTASRVAAPTRVEWALGVRPEDRDRGARGPSPERVDLLDGWRPDPEVSLRERDILSFPRVFKDQQEASGIYYFQPESYQLAWDTYEGYALRMLYQAANGGGSEGSGGGGVLVRMTLDAGIDPAEIEVARSLLRAQRLRRALPSFSGLSRIPIQEVPQVELAADLEQLFDIPADKVRAAGVSDPLGRLDLALTTDSVTKENLQLALLEGGGLGGRVRLQPVGDQVGNQAIPFSIDPSSRANFPRVYWRPGTTWQNQLPYPVLLRYLHVLRLENQRPVVYSWSLGERQVPRGASLEIDPTPIPKRALDGALQVWLDYVLEDSCGQCEEEILAAVTSGVSTVASSEIVFRTLSPLADTGAVEIALEVRSRFFHPRSRELRTQPLLILDQDGGSFPMGPIYSADQQELGEAAGQHLYEYRLRLVMPDGTLYDSPRWVPASALYQPIGTVQLEEALGGLPGRVDSSDGSGR